MKNRIRECRKAAGLSLKELSKLVGTSFVTISRYERGDNEPSIIMWECLASTLHVSPAYLVGWSDEKGERK